MLSTDLKKSFDPPSSSDCFSVVLFRLIRKADMENHLKLEVVFPEHVRLHRRWLKEGDKVFGEI